MDNAPWPRVPERFQLRGEELQELIEFCKEKNKNTEAVIETVEWENFSEALFRRIGSNPHLQLAVDDFVGSWIESNG